tara:strand:- start:208 stop:1617 length:1410 start_codon:yes stop_codon:yes gene_type:complete
MSDKVYKSQPFELQTNNSGQTGTFMTTVTNGEISSIHVLDSDGNYKPVVPGTDIFNEAASHQNSLDAISINLYDKPGQVSETILQDKEQLDQNYTTLKTAYDNKEFISAEETDTVVETGVDDTTTDPPKVLAYPADIDRNQDYIKISQYEYKRLETYVGGGGASSVQGSRPDSSMISDKDKPYGDYKGGVILPMPKVSDSNGAEWGKSDLNVLGLGMASMGEDALNAINTELKKSEQLGEVFNNPLGSLSSQFTQFFGNADGSFTKGDEIGNADLMRQNLGGGKLANINARDFGLAGLGYGAEILADKAGIDISANEFLARSTGTILNPNAELLFQGPVLRDFGFTFLMIARDNKEAEVIRDIIRFFKIGSAPVFLGGPSLLGTPNIFKLEYKSDSENALKGEEGVLHTVNRFNELALRTITVDYAPDGFWSAYEDSHPVAVRMMLQFSELKPVYRSDHEKTPLGSVGY